MCKLLSKSSRSHFAERKAHVRCADEKPPESKLKRLGTVVVTRLVRLGLQFFDWLKPSRTQRTAMAEPTTTNQPPMIGPTIVPNSFRERTTVTLLAFGSFSQSWPQGSSSPIHFVPTAIFEYTKTDFAPPNLGFANSYPAMATTNSAHPVEITNPSLTHPVKRFIV